MPDYMNRDLLRPILGQESRMPQMMDPNVNNQMPQTSKDILGPPSPNDATFDQPPDISQVDIGKPDRDSVGQEDEVTKLVGKLYTPHHEIADKFNEVWNQMPQREKPSVLRRIVASMVGAGGGPKAADQVLDAPYNEARGEWMDKLKMLQPALSDERYQNINEMNQRKLDETERKSKAAEADKDARTEIAADRAATYKYKSEHPGEQLVEDEDGQLMAVNKADGSMHYVLRPDGTPVKSLKNLNAADKQANDIKGRKEIAAIQGANQIKAAGARGAASIAVEKEKQKGRQEIKEQKDANGEVTSRTTTVYDADNNVTGSKTETFTKKPVKPSGPDKNVTVPENVGKVKMSAPDGRIIMVPMDKVAEAEQRGAKRVK